MACLDELCSTHDVEADVVAYPVNADAPFQFSHSDRIHVTPRSSISDSQLIAMVRENPYDLVFTGGWFDKGYLAALRHRACPALLGFDNAWNGSTKQYISALYGRFFIQPLFDYAFVPGSKQKQFARKLGFAEEKIITGAYSCDVIKFNKVKAHQESKNRLIYAGRYSEEKYILPLFDIFHSLAETSLPNWELHCIGTGPLWEKRLNSPHIIHHGFMQPDDLLKFMATGNAFVLPSTFEPWGVVVHEFAAAGYPMVLSDAVGAAEAFLKDRVNGYVFNAGNKEGLKAALEMLLSHNATQLKQMGHISRELASSITPTTWAASIARILQ